MTSLRPYQREAVNALYDYFTPEKRNPLIVAPTGSGKSHIIAAFIHETLERYPGQRICMLTHVRELIVQNYEKLRAHWPFAPAGIYSAGLNRRDTQQPIVFAGIQSVYRRAKKLGRFDVIMVDEAHLVPKGTEGMYRRFLDDALDINPSLVVVGLTATPFRMKGGLLHRGKGKLFDGIAYTCDILKLISDGYLSPLVAKKTKAEIDTTGIHTRGGEFVQGELEELVDNGELVKEAVTEILEYGHDRRAWLVFCVGIQHAKSVTAELRGRGIAAELVTGETPTDERNRLLERYKTGELRALVNVNVLTTGFDAPQTDLLAVLRPTQSPGLHVQILGRGMRVAPGKTDCILRGTLVLTDRGEVPIESVTTDMLVWDGVEFVRHAGPVCRGVRSVVTYAGITGTADHRVLTRSGWRSLQECIDEGEDICVGSENRRPVRQVEARFRSDKRGETPPGYRGVHGVRDGIREGCAELRVGHGRLPPLRPSKIGAPMACIQVHRSKAAMHKSKRQPVQRLRWPRDQVLVLRPDGNGAVGNAEPGLQERAADRPHRQRRPLRARQPSHGESQSQSVQYEGIPGHRGDACFQDGASRDSIRRFDLGEITQDSRLARCRGPILQAKPQAEGEVWDILNAGPRHRFTAAGLIVSNCLVLDFGQNCARHGPINLIKSRSDGTVGVAPTKACPECNTIVFAGTTKCPDPECGYIWERVQETKPRHDRKASTIDPISWTGTQELEVTETCYARHLKPGKPDSLKVTYWCGLTSYHEWICLEHDGFAGEKARTWWSKRGHMPAPMSVTKALERTGELRKVSGIRVDVSERYPRVVGVKFEQAAEAARQ